MKTGIVCQACGIEAPTKYVEFYQNIGALFMRFHKSIKGNLCKRCINENFWSMTLITILVGWLGIISLIIAPFLVLNNIIRYLAALGMPAAPPDARPPVVNDATFRGFLPHAPAIFERLNAGEDLIELCQKLSPQTNLTPGQLLHCIAAAAQMPAGQVEAILAPPTETTSTPASPAVPATPLKSPAPPAPAIPPPPLPDERIGL
jgi:hypothetical protein